jgi:phosphatidylglycerophosphate synthase
MAQWTDKYIGPVVLSIFRPPIRANHVTFIRVGLLLPVIALYLSGYCWTAVILHIIASLLDAVDGMIARLRHEKSDAGAMLDAIGDKLYVVPLLWIAYSTTESLTFTVCLVATVLEIALAALRPLKSWIGVTSDANWLGKLKLHVQSWAVAMPMTLTAWWMTKAEWTLWIANVLAMASLVLHVRSMMAKNCRNTTIPEGLTKG